MYEGCEVRRCAWDGRRAGRTGEEGRKEQEDDERLEMTVRIRLEGERSGEEAKRRGNKDKTTRRGSVEDAWKREREREKSGKRPRGKCARRG